MKKAIIIIIILVLIPVSINYYVVHSTEDRILSDSEVIKMKADAILILGAKAYYDRPSDMLADRIREGVKLYNSGISNKIIMSGDHGKKSYNEVKIMKNEAIKKRVPSSDIFMDHAGFSTYDSIYRAKEIFGCETLIIVTQDYHLHRAIYIANKLGIDAYGYYQNPMVYMGQNMRDVREFIARNKDFFKTLFKMKPKILGEKIPLLDGDVTNDY